MIEIRHVNENDNIEEIYSLLENLIEFHSNINSEYKRLHIEKDNDETKQDAINDIKGRYSYIAIKNENVIGLLVAYKKKSFIYISDLYVIPEYRNINIGGKLLDKIINDYPKEDLRLLILKENRSVIKFYRKYGFRHIGNVLPKKYNITCLELERKSDKNN